MKSGDLVLYDKFGSSWPDLSPSIIPDDFGIGLVLKIIRNCPEDTNDDDSYAIVIKDDGSQGAFSLSYVVQLDYFKKY